MSDVAYLRIDGLGPEDLGDDLRELADLVHATLHHEYAGEYDGVIPVYDPEHDPNLDLEGDADDARECLESALDYLLDVDVEPGEPGAARISLAESAVRLALFASSELELFLGVEDAQRHLQVVETVAVDDDVLWGARHASQLLLWAEHVASGAVDPSVDLDVGGREEVEP